MTRWVYVNVDFEDLNMIPLKSICDLWYVICYVNKLCFDAVIFDKNCYGYWIMYYFIIMYNDNRKLWCRLWWFLNEFYTYMVRIEFPLYIRNVS